MVVTARIRRGSFPNCGDAGPCAKTPLLADYGRLLTKISAPHELLFHKMSPYARTAQRRLEAYVPPKHTTRTCGRFSPTAAGRASTPANLHLT